MQTTRFQNQQQQPHTHGALNSISIKITLQLLQTEPVSFSIRQNAKQIFDVCIDAPHSNLIYGVQFAGGSNINVNDLFSQFKLCFSIREGIWWQQ